LLSAVLAARKACDISLEDLAKRAGIKYDTLRYYAKVGRCSPLILAKLKRVIETSQPIVVDRSPLVRTAFAAFLTQTADYYGVTVEQVRAVRFGDKRTSYPHVLACIRARAAAIYLVNTSLEIRQAELAAIFGVSRATICLALQSVETRRDEPTFDAFITRAQARITGES
jgi:DNA-binding XRE family transcriptional regulator